MTKIFDSARILASSLLLLLAALTQESIASDIFIRKAGSGTDDNIQISFAAQSSTLSSTLSSFLSGDAATKSGSTSQYCIEDGDSIYIAEGKYTLSSKITIKKNNLKIYGGFTNDKTFFDADLTARDSSKTILDGVDSKQILEFNCTGSGETRLDGFTIQNANSENVGAGINIASTNKNSLTIANCVIKNNKVSQDSTNGAGIYISNQTNDVTIENCVFDNNTGSNIIYIDGQDGEGAGTVTSTRTIKQCTFKNNSGTAITSYKSNFHLSDSTFTNNTGSSAGALYLQRLANDSYVKHCTFIGNTCTDTDKKADNIKYEGNSDLHNIYNCILDNGSNINVTGDTAENGNLTGITSLTSSDANSPSCNVPHTIFAIDKFSQAIGLGKKDYMTESDQLGRKRDLTYPSIGAVEFTPIELTGDSDYDSEINAYVGVPLEFSFSPTYPEILTFTWGVTNSANIQLTKNEGSSAIKLSCLPLSEGTGSITVTASARNDSAVFSFSKTITLKISPVAITADKTEITGQVLESLSQTVNLTITPENNYSWTLTPSSEQNGIKASLTGTNQNAVLTFTGTPEKAGEYTYTVKASPKNLPDVSASASVTLKVEKAAITALFVEIESLYRAFDEGTHNIVPLGASVRLTRKDNSSENVSDANIKYNASLPAGITISYGNLNIPQTAAPGLYQISITASVEYQGFKASSTADVTIEIRKHPTRITAEIETDSVTPIIKTGSSLLMKLSIQEIVENQGRGQREIFSQRAGSLSDYSVRWSGSNLPSGVSINDTTGKITVKSDAAEGSYVVKIKAAVNGFGLQTEAEKDITLTIANSHDTGGDEIDDTDNNNNNDNEEKGSTNYDDLTKESDVIFTSSLPSAEIFYKTFYAHQFKTRLNEAKNINTNLIEVVYGYKGELPPGLELTKDGKLSGTPTDKGTFNFTVEAIHTVNDGDGSLSLKKLKGLQDVSMTILDTPDVAFDFQPVKKDVSWRVGTSRRGDDTIFGDTSGSVRHIVIRGSDVKFSEINKGAYSSYKWHTGTEAGTSYIEFKKDLLGEYVSHETVAQNELYENALYNSYGVEGYEDYNYYEDYFKRSLSNGITEGPTASAVVSNGSTRVRGTSTMIVATIRRPALTSMTGVTLLDLSVIAKNEYAGKSASDSESRSQVHTSSAVRVSDNDDDEDSSIILVIGKAANAYSETLDGADLTQEQINMVKGIIFSSSDVTDMKGIERFPALTSITLEDCTRIKDLDLSSILSPDSVITLEAWRCPALESINVKGCVSLDVLEGVDCPKLNAVNLEGCVSLKTLALNNTNISELNLSSCPELVYLDVTECPNLEKLNGLTNCTKLDSFRAGYTKINELDISGMSGLRKIFANEMPLTSLNASGCPELQDLSFANASSLKSLNISGCKLIRRLDLSGSSVEYLDVSGSENLGRLDISGCVNLSSLKINNCSSLKTLNVMGTQISELDLTGCASLDTFIADGCTSLDFADFNGCESLRTISINGTGTTSLDLSGMTRLESLNAGSCSSLTSLDLRGCNSLRELDISGCGLSDNAIFTDCVKLEKLSCNGNKFTYLDLTNFEALNYVECGLQTASEFETGTSVNLSGFVNGNTQNISDVRAYDNEGSMSKAVSYSPETGIAEFESVPVSVSYKYDTGFEADSGNLLMSVLLTEGKVSSNEDNTDNESEGGRENNKEPDNKEPDDNKPDDVNEENNQPEDNNDDKNSDDNILTAASGGCNSGLGFMGLALILFALRKTR